MKIKFTKGELKRQRDALRQYERYLPTLQLKKQQLQAEILHQLVILEGKNKEEQRKRQAIEVWAGLFADPQINIRPWIVPKATICNSRNIAGVDLPVFAGVQFDPAEYDLFTAPLWVDNAIEALKAVVCLRQEIKALEQAIAILRQELKITTQRVNLFEKVKIPEAQESIRLIKIYIGDQMTNAVGRSKIAKKKIEAGVLEEVAV
ncbi:MAG: V-type ATP synthase subunit D [Candidatus Omnitrophota bacterium]|nr:V-type ATP synthase subunit D [Candidatus Omnitrophota bacterium]